MSEETMSENGNKHTDWQKIHSVCLYIERIEKSLRECRRPIWNLQSDLVVSRTSESTDDFLRSGCFMMEKTNESMHLLEKALLDIENLKTIIYDKELKK